MCLLVTSQWGSTVNKWKSKLACSLKRGRDKAIYQVKKKIYGKKNPHHNKTQVEQIKKPESLGETKLPLFLFSATFPHGDHWKHICIVPVSGCFAEKKPSSLFWYWDLLGEVVFWICHCVLFLGKNKWRRRAGKLWLSLGRGPVSPTLWILAPSK